MNSLSNLPPTGLLFRLRVIVQEQKGSACSSFFFPPPHGTKSERVSMTAQGGSFIPNGKNKWAHPKTEVIPRTGLQEEPASFNGASSLPRGGFLPGMAPRSLRFHPESQIPVRYRGSRCSQAILISTFHYCRHSRLLGSKVEGCLTEKCRAASSHKAMCPSLPLNRLVSVPIFPYSSTSFLFHTINTHLPTPTQPHT